jgi:uncharacterized MAPEG superfamily protein
MEIKLTTELFWLVATTLMTALLWVPYILNRLLEQGILKALWDPEGRTETKHAWAERMMRAHENAVENLVVFSSLVLAAHVAGVSTEATATASMVYFYARAAHFLVFSLKIPVLRVVTFLIGFGAQMVFALTLLGRL